MYKYSKCHLDGLFFLSIFRLRLAFDLATRYLHIDALLDPEDVNTNKPDKKSILMYVMCLYQAIETFRSAKLSNATSIQLLDQHVDGSLEEIASTSTSEAQKMEQFEGKNSDKIHHQLNPIDTAHVGNLTDLDEISLAKSIEDLSNFPLPNIKRSSTFTITKNELVNLSSTESGDLVSTDVNTENSTTSNQFQNFLEAHSRPLSTATNASVEIGGYQSAIEIVLSLLLEAEEILSRPMSDITELIEAKSQFQSHEEFMIKLSEYQEYVGGALEEGARLLSEPTTVTGLTSEDHNEIKQQVLKK